ncbi:MAG TPA: hypothetical protein DCX22_02840 [Dehalococcoidia bacterium]|nr:hypothetical protein [Dehalococcoidia bacterium]
MVRCHFFQGELINEAVRLKVQEMIITECGHAYAVMRGGSGLVAIPEWSDIRLNSGIMKAEQISKTGVEIIVTSCDNCRHQISELHNLNIGVISVSELTVKVLAV